MHALIRSLGLGVSKNFYVKYCSIASMKIAYRGSDFLEMDSGSG